MSKADNPAYFPSPRSSRRIHAVSGIILNYEGSSDLTFVRPPDVSVRGMFVNTSRSFPEGAILNVRFRLALSGASVSARAEVRYCLPGVGVGLEFCDLDAATRKLLEKEIALNNPRSARKSRRTATLRKRSGKRTRSRKRPH